jgi:hypothetical protein
LRLFSTKRLPWPTISIHWGLSLIIFPQELGSLLLYPHSLSRSAFQGQFHLQTILLLNFYNQRKNLGSILISF